MSLTNAVRRGRGIAPGLVAVLGLACGDGGPGPVGEPMPGYEPPVVEQGPDAVHLANSGPAQRLITYETLPTKGATLLFMGGRAATPVPGGGSIWADMDGARIVRFDGDGVVRAVLGGAPDGGPPLTHPVFAALDGDAVLAVDLDGQALRFEGGEPVEWIPSPLPGGAVGGYGSLVSTRTVFDIQIAPLPAGAPLLWSMAGGEVRPMGSLRTAQQALLSPVVNAGWVAAAPDGGVYFASAVRPELHRYGPQGNLEWVSTWARPDVSEPRFGAVDGTLTPVFRLIQQSVAVGPRGRVYVLGTTGAEGQADRILAFQSDGTWVGEAPVGPHDAIYLGPRGHVYRTERDDALSRTLSSPAAIAFQPFTLPPLDPGVEGEGAGSGAAAPDIRLEDHLGKVVVVNFWASWCIPCRREMPLLDEFSRELDSDEAVVLGLNEDVDPGSGLAFLEEIGGVHYAVAKGLGRLRATYGYRGLPYTVVLDRQGRFVKGFYGFGASIDPIRETTMTELASGG